MLPYAVLLVLGAVLVVVGIVAHDVQWVSFIGVLLMGVGFVLFALRGQHTR